jgi:hypothetical protein
MTSSISQEFTDKLLKVVKKKHGGSRKRFMSIEAREEYNQTIKTLEKLCEVFLK